MPGLSLNEWNIGNADSADSRWRVRLAGWLLASAGPRRQQRRLGLWWVCLRESIGSETVSWWRQLLSSRSCLGGSPGRRGMRISGTSHKLWGSRGNRTSHTPKSSMNRWSTKLKGGLMLRQC